MRQSAPGSQGGSTRPRKDIEPNDLIVELAEIAVEKPRRAALNPLHTQADRKPTGREVDREVQAAPRQLSPGSPNAPSAPASLWRLRRAAGLRVAYHVVPSAQRSTPRARRRAARRYAGPGARPVRPGSTSSSRDVRQSPPITRERKRGGKAGPTKSTSGPSATPPPNQRPCQRRPRACIWGECTRLIDRRQRMLSALVASVRGCIRDAWL